MKQYGAVHLHRLMALVLTVMMLMTTCYTPALAANIWDETVLNLLWTDDRGEVRTYPGTPVEAGTERAYWVNVDAAALGQTLTVEALCPDPAYAFYFEDEMGGQTQSFIWLEEMDALGLGYEYAHMLWYSVDGAQADMPILLYVSSMPMPEEEFEPFPVQVPVYYVADDGTVLDTQYMECWAGETTPVWASSRNTTDYALNGADSVDVYVDENGVPTPGEVYFTYTQIATPTPEPTDVPTPTPVAEVSVPVVYYHMNGEQLDFQERFLAPGTHLIQADSSRVAGYVPVGDTAVEITVYPDGSTNLASVVFYYDDPAPVEAVIPVYYYHVDGTLLDMEERTLTEGRYEITPNSAKVSGLELDGPSSVAVTVYADGSADVGYVAFTYKDAYVAPVEAVIPVYYYHVDGTLLDMEERTLTEGRYEITPNSAKVSGLELDGPSSAMVTVYADGSADVGYVAFTYKDAYVAPVEVSVTVNYYHVDRGLLDTQSIPLTEGTHIVRADSSKTADYLPVGSTSVEVTVGADGSVRPDPVEFYYEDAAAKEVAAELTVLYYLADGTFLARDSVILKEGSHIVQPNPEMYSGYVLNGEQSYAVHVDGNGFISPEPTVTFSIRHAEVNVTAHYQDDRGRDVAPTQTYNFTEDGVYSIKAAPEGLTDDYELAPGLHTEVTVTVVDGVASQSDVYFYYQQKQTAPAMANVAVHYFDTYGNEIASAQTVTLEVGKHQLRAEPDNLPQGYELVSEATITVEVYDNGTFSPQEVAFYYRPVKAEEKQATITVRFCDDRGNDVAASQTFKYGDGTHVIYARPEDLPAGYEIFEGTDDSVEITVRNGVATKSQIVFYYQYRQPVQETTEFTLPVYYYDTEGRQIASSQTVKVAPGTYSIKANPVDLPAGYELKMEEMLTVTVFADGTTNPEEIAFYYSAPDKKATIIVAYLNDEHQTITDPFTMELDSGYHTIGADASRVPSGYDPDSAEPVKVYVSREGEANPDQVTLIFERLVVETPIPVGENVYRYATVNSGSVAFRNEPTTSGGNKTVIKRLNKGDKVYVLEELYNDKHEVWAMVNIDGRIGYMMSEFIDIMTQQKSDEYAVGNTPVPTFTPVPTATSVPTATPTQEPTVPPTAEPTDSMVEAITPPASASPTLEPLPGDTATATPTASPSPTPYTGYALTTRVTALRTGISSSDMTIIQSLEANALVKVVTQMSDPTTGAVWSIVSTLGNQAGYVQDAALRYISDREAEPYLALWEEQNKSPEPTEYVSPTPEPMQLEGYGEVLGDEVPFRQMASEFSRIIDNLEAGTYVFITGQTWVDGIAWHSVNYEGHWGYIRADLVRMLTIAEEEEYLDRINATPTPEPVTTNLPFDTNGMSSYGYVDGSSVNWRQGPSTGEKKVGELKRYAFCLVLDSEYVDGVTWYKVRYGDKTGYIHGDFFKQMTITELEEFLGSDEYLQGVANNSVSGDSAMDDVGFTGTGGIVSAEDQWVNNNPDVYASFAPFNPIATVAPIQTTPTLEPLPGWSTDAPTASPTPTPTFNPLPDVTYPTTDDGQGGSAIVWAVVIGLLLLAVGGVFALVRYQQNRRRIAMRAAQRRAQAARAQQQQQRPYARTVNPTQPRTGTYPNQQTTVRRPAANGTAGQTNQSTSQYAPYSGAGTYGTGGCYRPTQESDSEAGVQQSTQRVGRRTAYRQAQEAARQNQESQDNDLNM